jgi:hypothetical protein
MNNNNDFILLKLEKLKFSSFLFVSHKVSDLLNCNETVNDCQKKTLNNNASVSFLFKLLIYKITIYILSIQIKKKLKFLYLYI